MSDNSHIQIPFNKLSTGMILAEDIFTPKGLLLIPKNTLLNETHIFRIKLYQIFSVAIFIPEDFTEKGSSRKPNPLNVKFNYHITQNFSDFKELYYLHQALTEKKLTEINQGTAIDVEELYAIVTRILDSLITKDDLFTYLYHLHLEGDYTYSHCLNVALIAHLFARWLKLSESQIIEVTVSGFLHDIGKLNVDQNILNSPRKLSREEFEKVKLHTNYGYEAIKTQPISDDIKKGVLLHHERSDGSGYPTGITEAYIPLIAKIIGIVDIYDAMISNRTYHENFSPFKIISMFENESHNLLDFQLLSVFLENMAHIYLGKDALLSTGERARIVFIHNDTPSRPIVQINGKMVDLCKELTINIIDIL